MHFAALHIPEGIRFECTNCGNCCLTCPVPATSEDVTRITARTYEDLDLDLNLAKSGRPLFKAYTAGTAAMRGFSHTLEKRADGRCQFLTEDNLCLLHAKFGPDAKPSMCRLFPYSFVTTPSGAYAYASFASSAVLFNAGLLLSEQHQLLEEKYALFQQLFPTATDWSGIQLLDGCQLSWPEYLFVEELALAAFNDKENAPALGKLTQSSQTIIAQLPAHANPEKMPPIESRPKIVDQLIIKHFFEFYFPDDLFHGCPEDFDIRNLMEKIVAAPPSVSLTYRGRQIRFQQVIEQRLSNLDRRCEDLLVRFAYCRLFAKLYFGPSLAFLSVISGIHHLAVLIALLRIKAKLAEIAGERLTFEAFAEALRALERRLTQLNFSRESASALEVLLSSPSRLERIAYIAR